MAQGWSPAELAQVERISEARLRQLTDDPAFQRLVDGHGALAALPQEERERQLIGAAQCLLEEAVAMGDIRAAQFVATEAQMGRSPARSLAEAVLRIRERMGLERFQPPPDLDPRDEPLLRDQPGGALLTARDPDRTPPAVDPADPDAPRPAPWRRVWGHCAGVLDPETTEALIEAEIGDAARIHASTERRLARRLEQELARAMALGGPTAESARRAALRRFARTANANPGRAAQALDRLTSRLDGTLEPPEPQPAPPQPAPPTPRHPPDG